MTHIEETLAKRVQGRLYDAIHNPDSNYSWNAADVLTKEAVEDLAEDAKLLGVVMPKVNTKLIAKSAWAAYYTRHG